jgi:transglutaminase-like putative cysteine protease
MEISLDWHSVYRYDPPVRLLNMELHVVPIITGTQEVIDYELEVDPPGPVNAHTRADAFGNTMHSVNLLGPVERVHVTLRAKVRTNAGMSVQPEPTPLMRMLALRPTHRAPADPRISELAADAGDPTDPLAYAERLTGLIADRFEFEVGQSDVEDSALELLDRRRGVCQDFAHLMLATLRSQSIPALYVSGYLAPSGGFADADASHAWVRVLADGTWHGFDAANRASENERYVVTALGRDYDDVAPVRGSYQGLAEESWSAAVRLEAHTPQ